MSTRDNDHNSLVEQVDTQFTPGEVRDYSMRAAQQITMRKMEGVEKYGPTFVGYPPAQGVQEAMDEIWYHQHSDNIIRTQHQSMDKLLALISELRRDQVVSHVGKNVIAEAEDVHAKVQAMLTAAEEEGYVPVRL